MHLLNQQNNSMKPLTIYKASAGSGKTFRLAVEYIKLLIRNPLSFHTTLAVTFTNKATEEMKMRILSQLYGIWKLLPDSESYINEVTHSLDISRETASSQAGIALSHLIHNYNYFHVETIDAFFQTVLRNLARELDLTANLRIELNDTQVEEQAVDRLIESLSSTSIMLQWLINYIEENINDNKSWNVIGQIKSFGRTIFKEYYKMASNGLDERTQEKDFFKNYMTRLRKICTDAKRHMAQYAEEFMRITTEAGLTPMSFAGKRNGINSYFNKLARGEDFSDGNCMNKTLAKHLESAENWASKNSPDRATIIAVADSQLMPLLRKAEEERTHKWRLYMSANVTLRHLDKLRLLNNIEKKVRELNNDANRFLLSDTQYLLHTLIKDTDSSFVFEKIGSKLEHVMIDEFQDTSRIQWQNFKVLLQECMSYTPKYDDIIRNLIVGDVKQSIYRWRSGDWRLLNNINNQFPAPEKSLDIKSLQTNYRSEQNIINFNNAFFETAVALEYKAEQAINENGAAQITSAYSDVCQDFSAGHEASKGYVRITLFDNEDYDDTMLESVVETVNRLQSSGTKLSDIAILIRYNRHIQAIASYFMENRPDLKVVSDEAFRLDASIAVTTIMQALRVLNNPDDILSKASLAAVYQRKILGNNISESSMFCDADNIKILDSLLPEVFTSERKTLLRLPLYDMIEELYSILYIGRIKNQSAYVCTFFDNVSKFITDNTGNLEEFIRYWDETLCSKNIQSDETDGIKLISIHKSKGLEFENVIIPFCDWKLETTRDNTIWCVPTEAPFNELPIVPIDYSSKLLETIYATDYLEEHLQNTVDNLNLLYVAFTRAKKNLFVMGKKNGKGTRSAIIATCLPEISTKLVGFTYSEGNNDGDATVFEYGSLCIEHGGKSRTSDNVFLQNVEYRKINLESHKLSVNFRQSNKSRDFIGANDAESEQQTYIKMGNILHNLFSKIRTTADIDCVIRQLEFDGVLYDNDITAERMRETLSKRLSDKRVADWFNPRWTLFNECSILFIDPNTNALVERRPDRVITDGNEIKVIDFKFGKPCEDYHRQVREYMHLLQSMNKTARISGFLWFVYSNRIEEVSIEA